MNFLHWWAIGIGAVAIAGPLVVHWLTRPKPTRFALSTLRLLQEIIVQRRARNRLRDLLILLLRMLAVAAIALALARPQFNTDRMVSDMAEGATARVIVLDTSQSMLAGEGGATAFLRAQAAALRYAEYGPQLQLNVILAGAKPRPAFDRLSQNYQACRETIQSASVLDERANVQAAMNLAGQLLQNVNASERELVIISDFQRSNWGKLYLEALPERTKIQLESVAEEEAKNVGIIGIRTTGTAMRGQSIGIEVEMMNSSPEERQVSCEVQWDGIVRRMQGKVQANGTNTLATTFPCEEAKWAFGWARLVDHRDALPADDQRPFAAQIHDVPKIVLASRQSTQNKLQSSFFLQQAIEVIFPVGPTSPDDSPRLIRIQPQKLNSQPWAEADIYLLSQPGLIEESQLKLLANRIQLGKGLLYIISDDVDAANLAILSQALGSNFQPPVQFVPETNKRKDLFLSQVRSRQPPFQVFGENALTALRTARFSGGLASQLEAEGLRDQILGTLSDGSCWMYETSVGAGVITVINADLDNSNWCTQASFLPILNESIQSMLAQRRDSQEAFCGESLIRTITEVTESSQLESGPADELSPRGENYGNFEWSKDQNAFNWTWLNPVGAGNYLTRDGGKIVHGLAVAAPGSEADLKGLEKSTLQDRLAGSRKIGVRSDLDQEENQDSLWTWMIMACVLGLISEILMLKWFRS